MKKLRANTVKPVVLQPVYPNVGVQVWYEQELTRRINAAAGNLLTMLAAAWAKTPPLLHSSHITAAYGDAALEPNAAGVLFRAPSGRVLLTFRTDGQGWAFPGGRVEENETPEAAARREAFEETLQPVNGPLSLVYTVDNEDSRFATFLADVVEEFEPTLNVEHDAHIWLTPDEAVKELGHRMHPGVYETLREAELDELAEDAPSPTKALQIALAKWGSQTIKTFDLMSAKIADDFAKRNAQATQASVMAQLKRAGFTVKFTPTRKSVEAFRLVAAENVALIKSIPRKYLDQVEQRVWNAVRTGSDLAKLSTELRKAHKITVDRAALIARDQNAKAKATIERVRQQELGITRGIWQHSAAGKEPRPTHVAMNGKQYSLAQGMWDSDEGEWVHPGQLINCRCTMRPVIEGFIV